MRKFIPAALFAVSTLVGCGKSEAPVTPDDTPDRATVIAGECNAQIGARFQHTSLGLTQGVRTALTHACVKDQLHGQVDYLPPQTGHSNSICQRIVSEATTTISRETRARMTSYCAGHANRGSISEPTPQLPARETHETRVVEICREDVGAPLRRAHARRGTYAAANTATIDEIEAKCRALLLQANPTNLGPSQPPVRALPACRDLENNLIEAFDTLDRPLSTQAQGLVRNIRDFCNVAILHRR